MRRWFGAVAVAMIGVGAAGAKLPPCPAKRPQLFIAPTGEAVRAPIGAPSPASAWFARVDSNGDGRLTLAELSNEADRVFATLDLDHDGQLLPDEISAYERTIPEMAIYARRSGGAAADRYRKKPKNQTYDATATGAGRWSWINVPEPVSAADTDFDRAVTLAEYRAAVAQRFARLDTGALGFLTLARLPKTPAEAEASECDSTRPPPKPRRERDEDDQRPPERRR